MPASKSLSESSKTRYTIWIKRWHDPIESWEFYALSPDEAKVNMARILAAIPWRMRQLKALVRQSKGYEKWKPDFKKKSFEQLMWWLPSVVKRRRRTEEEIDRELAGNKMLILFPGETLDKWLPTDMTESIAYDCAIYAGLDLLSRCKSAAWSMKFAKTLAVKHHPVIATKKQEVSVFALMRIHVLMLLSREADAERMIAVHEEWVWLLTNKRPKRVLKVLRK